MTHWERWEQGAPHSLPLRVSLPLFTSPFWPCSNQSACSWFLADCRLLCVAAKWDESGTLFGSHDVELRASDCWGARVQVHAWRVKRKVVVTCGMLGGQQRDSMLQGGRTHTHTHTQKRSEQPVTVAVEAFSTSLQAGLPWGCEKTHHAKRKKKENTLLRGGCSSLWRLTGASLPWPEHLIRSLCACSIRPATSQCMTHSLRLGDTVTHHLPPASHQLSFRKEFSGVINLALCHPSLSKHTWCFF